MRTP